MKFALRLVLLFSCLAVLLSAAGPSGTWKGDFDFNGTSVPLTFNLKASSDALTGNIEGLPSAPAELHEGKVEGDNISFWVMVDYEGQSYKLLYKGKVSGDQIQFTFGTDDGSWGAEMTVKKSS